MDKKGFIRTLEAIIAIIIVFVFIYVISQKGVESATKASDSIKSLQEEILRGISEDESDIDNDPNKIVTKRSCIISLKTDIDFSNVDYSELETDDQTCVTAVQKYVKDNLPTKFKQNYALVICESNCGIPSILPDKNVYTTAVIITSSLQSDSKPYNPKIVRLWVW